MPTALVVPREAGGGRNVRSASIGEPEESPVTSSASNSEFGQPGLSRRDTEQILDYYQSEDAGRGYISSSSESYPSQPQRAAPTSARSAMNPSNIGRDSNTNPPRTSMESVASSSGSVQRRTSQRSAGGADKRRVAIVELDKGRPESQVSTLRERSSDISASFTQPPDATLFARRGLDSTRLRGLALVAPPDAQPADYSGLLPIPASAPATGVPPIYRATITEPTHNGHQRSMSDVQSFKKGPTRTSPRDVGIVGTLGSMLSSPQAHSERSHSKQQRPSTADGDGGNCEPRSDQLTSPVFQTPRSRSPSPLFLTTSVRPSTDALDSEQPLLAQGWSNGDVQQLTPDIGQEKDIGHPVVGPLVLDLSSGQPVRGRSPHVTMSVLPSTDLHGSAPYSHTDRNTQRTSSRLPFKPNQPSISYLHYQPGVHSIAGPLPSPPRSILTSQNASPPPRPPRMLSPPCTRQNEVEHATESSRGTRPDRSRSLQITSLRPAASLADSDFSISAVSASSSGSDDRTPGRSSSLPDENDATPRSIRHHNQTDKKAPRNGSHVREGAFPPSSVFLSHPSQAPPSHDQHPNLDKVVAYIGGPENEEASNPSSALASVTAAPPTLRHTDSRPKLKREHSWVSLSAESFGDGRDHRSPPSSYTSSDEESTRVTSTNIGSDDGLASRIRTSSPAPPIIEAQQRVDLLPRTTSLLSMGQHSRTAASSPSPHPAMPKKAPSSWPDSLNFQDVLAMRLAADRALAYAAKIRELATEETGLRDWLLLNARKERRDVLPATVSSTATATSRTFGKQPRHISRASMASELTFPIRNDSYTATDLSPRPMVDLSSISPSTVLPYPSLAHGVGVRKRSSRTLTVDSSVGSLSGSSRSLGGSFFASIGRKTSIKKDRPFPSTSPNKLISSRHPPQPPQPRPVKLGAPPTLPGGPRAPARSTQRANSVVFGSPEPPRVEGQVSSIPVSRSSESAEAFDPKVEKLSDLLPQADKGILAGYLRRAQNQDPMLAIGTYLEDERQGCLRRD